MRAVLAFVIVALLAVQASAVPKPDFMVLSAPWTPYKGSDLQVDVSPIPALAKNFAQSGVNTVWVGGGMGQFDTLTVDERNALAKAWVQAGHDNNLYIIVHVGTTVARDAIAMAEFAKAIGADAIASVPPYYERPDSISTLISWIKQITDRVDLPFYYYHIPGSTGVNFDMYPFTSQIYSTGAIPNFAGVKYVATTPGDFFACVNDPVLSKQYNYMWAPEPKLDSFPLIPLPTGTILAESFYAGYFLRRWNYYTNGQLTLARNEQSIFNQVDAVFGEFGGTPAKRAIYQTLCGVDIGQVQRLPATGSALTADQYQSLVAQLTALGFFNQTYPPFTAPNKDGL